MTQQTHPAVQALLDGVDNGDVDAFLGCFAEDGVVDDRGREFRGDRVSRMTIRVQQAQGRKRP